MDKYSKISSANYKKHDDNFQYENKKYKNFNYKRILNYIFENPKINFIKIKKQKLTY